MKKAVLTIVAVAFSLSVAHAFKPVETQGFDSYRNSFKLDVSSLVLCSPEIEWEHYTGTRFTYGVYAKAYLINRSSFSTQFPSQAEGPKDVVLFGDHYDVDWSHSPGCMYGEVQMDGETHEVRWDRRYTGVVIGPQGRFYMGRKPDRGFYLVAKANVGIFRESFDVFSSKVSLEERKRRRADHDAAAAAGKSYEYPNDHNEWEKAGNEKSNWEYSVCGGVGIGFQGWFRKNSHWGIDSHLIVKGTYGTPDREDHSLWEWFIGPALPFDYNLSVMYRF